MRRFVQAFIVIIGFTVAIAALEAEQRKPSIGDCYKLSAPVAPTICK